MKALGTLALLGVAFSFEDHEFRKGQIKFPDFNEKPTPSFHHNHHHSHGRKTDVTNNDSDKFLGDTLETSEGTKKSTVNYGLIKDLINLIKDIGQVDDVDDNELFRKKDIQKAFLDDALRVLKKEASNEPHDHHFHVRPTGKILRKTEKGFVDEGLKGAHQYKNATKKQNHDTKAKRRYEIMH